MERPETPKITVGTRLLVRSGLEARRVQRGAPEAVPVEAEVIRMARVWITLRAVKPEEATRLGYAPPLREWEMRLDTQDTEGPRYGYSRSYLDCYLTAEQYAYDRRLAAAREVIRGAGFERSLSGRIDDGLTVAVAEAIEQYRAGS